MTRRYDIGSTVRVVVIWRDLSATTKDPTTVIKARRPDTGATITGTAAQDPTTVAAASTGLALPQPTIYVASLPPYLPLAGTDPVTNQPLTNTATVVTSAGTQLVTYTGFTLGATPALTGCSGGAGTMSTGNAVIPVGVWHADFVPMVSDRWAYTAVATGVLVAAVHGEFFVNVQEIA